MARKKKNKRKQEKWDSFDEDSDETFAYIVGYTSGGVPYETTWEELEIAEKEYEENIQSSIKIDKSDLPF